MTCLAVPVALYRTKLSGKKRPLEGKTIWVTGASSGIGKAIANECGKVHGVKLVLSGRDAERLKEVRSDILKHNASMAEKDVAIVMFDLEECGRFENVAAEMHTKAVAKIGSPIDVIILAGGISMRGKAEETTLQVHHRLMNTNYFSSIALVRAVLPSMLCRARGNVVFISSLQGKFGIANRSSYAAAKFAVHGYAESLRVESEDRGVQVLVACPGYVSTNLSLNAANGDGSSYGKMDENTANGFEPSFVAQQVLLAVRNGEREIYIAKPLHQIAVYLKVVLPSGLNWYLKQRMHKEEKAANKSY